MSLSFKLLYVEFGISAALKMVLNSLTKNRKMIVKKLSWSLTKDCPTDDIPLKIMACLRFVPSEV